MLRLMVLIVLTIGTFTLNAQEYDKTWVLGTPMSFMTFNTDSISIGQLPDTTLRSFVTIGDICDANGRLVFYTNGVNVYNTSGNIMLNGDSLSAPSEYYDQVVQGGMPSQEGVVILPMSNDSNLYYIFHYTPTDTLDIADNAGYEALNLYYSIVDMRADSGRGALTSKNIPILQDELLSYSRLAACKHANGRDWWIVKNAWYENIYWEFLLTPDGVQGPFLQQIGPLYERINEQDAYSSFNQDGSRYVSLTSNSYIVLMDFDRCTGLFSNPQTIFNNTAFNGTSPVSGGVCGVFSPSGRFLYICNRLQINQYDLSSSRINDSVRIETLTDSTNFYQMDVMQLAPNGKIYISCWNGGSYSVHVINQPDSFGLACDFQLYGQLEASQSPVSIPYFPNYRLGALTGSPCDTISTGINTIAGAHPVFATVFPNPASTRAEIIYNLNKNSSSMAKLYDVEDRLLWSKTVSNSAGSIFIDFTAIPAGVYIVRFTSDGQPLLNTKLVVYK